MPPTRDDGDHIHRNSAAAIRDGLARTRWSTRDLWVAVLAIGGAFSHDDIDQIASGRRRMSPTEHDILATAFNDHFLDLGENHPIRYWRDL